MPDEHSEFQVLLARLKDGSEDAAQELFDRYGKHVLRVVRRQLDKRIRSKFDSVDFLQSVWASFFLHQEIRQYQFNGPEAFVAFLSRIARNKVVEAFRQRLKTKKYNVALEHSLSASSSKDYSQLIASDSPSPSQVALANEKWGQLQEGLQPRYQRILELLQEGHTHQEIAQRLDLNEKTIRRLIRRLAAEHA